MSLFSAFHLSLILTEKRHELKITLDWQIYEMGCYLGEKVFWPYRSLACEGLSGGVVFKECWVTLPVFCLFRKPQGLTLGS